MKPARIEAIEVFRGFAALAVVLYHAALSTDGLIFRLPRGVLEVAGSGVLGVDFFFVISGFVMGYAHGGDLRGARPALQYAIRRIIRLFPAYLPISALMIFGYAIFPELSASNGRQFSLLSSLFLIPANNPPALSVAWTMVHELIFYTIFLTRYISQRFFHIFLVAWAVMIFVNLDGEYASGWVQYLFSPLNYEFMMGVLAAYCVRSKKKLLDSRLILMLGLVLVFYAGVIFIERQDIGIRLLFASGIGLVVANISAKSMWPRLHWPRAMVLLGSASYSIYLVHNPILSLSQRLLGKMETDWVAAWIIGAIVSIVFGGLYFFLVERPAVTYFRKLYSKLL